MLHVRDLIGKLTGRARKSPFPTFHREELHSAEFPRFEELAESPPDSQVPYLDRSGVNESRLTAEQRAWRQNGFVILKNFIPHDIIDRYMDVRSKWPDLGGWACPTPYMHIPEIKELGLYAPFMNVMESLIGESMMMHLNLTGWISTEREWHQDDYLNPPFVNSYYAAAWFALDTIHPDCGPFEFVPGSHRWPLLRQEKIRTQLARFHPEQAAMEGRPEDGERGHWASHSEYFLKPAIEEKILREKGEVTSFLGEKGDVLIWHGRLIHRGSKARQKGMLRKSFIAHYSAISKRLDMPKLARKHVNGKHYAEIQIPLY